MSEPEEVTIKIPGAKLAGRAWGPRTGPLVLALHGWLDNAATFDGIAPHLEGVRLVALDLPGHGHSTHHPVGVLYPFMDYVADVFWALEAMQWTKFALLGHSLGAGVAAIFAGTFPDRVVRLGLLEGLGPLTEAPDLAPVRLANALNEQRRKAGRPAPRYASRDDVLARLTAAASRLSSDSAATLLGRGLDEDDAGTVGWRSDRRLRFASRVRLTEPQVLAFLRNIACPTLLVEANEGFNFDPVLGKARAEAIKNLEVVQVLGRHHVHLDAPQRVAPALQRFFGGLRRD